MIVNINKYSPGILARWYATPLDQQQAGDLKEQAEARQQQAIKKGRTSRVAILMEAVSHFWLSGEILHQLDSSTSPLRKSIHGKLLAQTISGQLLMSRQLSGGFERLQKSFKLAASLLKADDYFLLMERYKNLENIPLSKTAQNPKSLEELLNLGGVIEKLQDCKSKKIVHDPGDLYG